MRDHETVLLDAIHLLHEHGAGMFHERLFAAVRILYPGTTQTFELWRMADSAHEAHLTVPYSSRDLEWVTQRLGELVPLQHPSFHYMEKGGRDPVQLSDLVSHRQFANTELYEAAFKPVGLRQQLTIPLVTETHIGGITVNRTERRPFSVEEIRLAGRFARFVAQAHRVNDVLAQTSDARREVEMLDHLPLRRAGLSRREAEVLLWMAQGKRDKEIAIILGISHRTVTHHVSAILAKLGVENRTAAVAAVSAEGIQPSAASFPTDSDSTE